MNVDALSSVGNSLVGAVIGSGKFGRGTEGTPLLSYDHSDHDDQSAVRMLVLNPLMGTVNYSATSNNMKLVHWPLMGGLLHLVQRGGGDKLIISINPLSWSSELSL